MVDFYYAIGFSNWHRFSPVLATQPELDAAAQGVTEFSEMLVLIASRLNSINSEWSFNGGVATLLNPFTFHYRTRLST